MVEWVATPRFQGALALGRRKLGGTGQCGAIEGGAIEGGAVAGGPDEGPVNEDVVIKTLLETSVGNDPLVRQGDREDIPGSERPA